MSTRGNETTGTRRAGTVAAAKVPERKTAAALKAEAKARAEERLARTAARHATRTAAALDRLARARARNPHAFAVGTKRHDFAPAVERAFNQVAREMAGLDHERIVALNTRTAQRFYQHDGKPGDPVIWTRGSDNKAMREAGVVHIHNHYFGHDLYPTFSDADYKTYATVQPPGARVVTEKGVGTLLPRKDGTWPKYARDVKPALDRNWQAIDKALATQMQQAVRGGRDPQYVQMTDGDLMHLAWRRAAREVGLRYNRTTLPK